MKRIQVHLPFEARWEIFKLRIKSWRFERVLTGKRFNWFKAIWELFFPPKMEALFG